MKRFRFRYNAVLRVRRTSERLAEMELTIARAAERVAEEWHSAVVARTSSLIDSLAAVLIPGPLDRSALSRSEAALSSWQQRRHSTHRALVEAHQATVDAHQNYERAVAERKLLETLRKRDRKHHDALVRRHEQKISDEIAANSYRKAR